METLSDTGVSDLPDDCLLHIFSFLQWNDVIGMEQVCKRWQRVSLMSKKELDIIWKKVHLVEEILEKHGKTVVKLIIYAVDCRRDIFEIIDKHCTKLLKKFTFHVDNFPMDRINAKKFRFLKNLESFEFNSKGEWDSEKHWKLFCNLLDDADNLKNLAISKGFKSITMTNESLRLAGIKIKEHFNLEQFLQRFLKFKRHAEGDKLKLSFNCVKNFYLRSLEPIANQLTHLELKETYSDCFHEIRYQTLHFENLIELCLEKVSALTDSKFLNFTMKCPNLQKLLIYIDPECDRTAYRVPYYEKMAITDEGARFLGNWKNLTYIDIASSIITANTFEFIAINCKKLEFFDGGSSMSKLTAFELINIVSLMQNLKLLRLYCFEKLTKETLESISKTVKDRKNNVKLHLEYCNTVKIEETKKLMLKERSLDSDNIEVYLTMSVYTTDEPWNICGKIFDVPY